MAAVSTTGMNGRGRRVSCTVALAVAGAFAAVSVGWVLALSMIKDSGNNDDQDEP